MNILITENFEIGSSKFSIKKYSSIKLDLIKWENGGGHF